MYGYVRHPQFLDSYDSTIEAPGSPELLVPTERPSPTSPGGKAEEAQSGGGCRLVVGCWLFVEHMIKQSKNCKSY